MSESFQRRGLCLVIAAPSGAGKSTIVRALRAGDPNVRVSISVTTRKPRPGEKEGVDYLFRSPKEFAQMVKAGDLLESATVFGQSYGTLRAPVEAALAAGHDIIFDIDWQGYRQLRAALPGDVVGLFILPPTLPELRRRLEARGTDSEDAINERMNVAMAEIAHWPEFDHVVINRDLPTAIEEARAVLVSERGRVSRQTGLRARGFVA